MSSANLNFTCRETKYNRCIWNILHIKTATQIICGLALLASILSVVGFIVNENAKFYDYWQLGRAIIGACAFIAATVGIHRIQPKLILVCLFWIGTRMILYTGYVLGLLVGYFPNSLLGYFYRQVMDFYAKDVGVLNCHVPDTSMFLRSVAMLILYIWIFDLIHQCYKYITAKAGDEVVALPQSGVSKVSIHEEAKTAV